MKLFVITGTCGSGKSTMKDFLAERLDSSQFVGIDSDETGLNWWDYAGTENEDKYNTDSLNRAIEMAEGKNLIFVSCLNPIDYFTKYDVHKEIESTHFIALCPSDEEIEKRLKARPADRGFTSDEAIRPHVEYNGWFRKNKAKFQLFLDNTETTEEETAEQIASYILKVC